MLSQRPLNITLTRILHVLFGIGRSSLPSSEQFNSSIVQEITHLSRNPKVYSCVKDNPSLQPMLSFLIIVYIYFPILISSSLSIGHRSKLLLPRFPIKLSWPFLVLPTSICRLVHLSLFSLIYLYTSNIWQKSSNHNGPLYGQSVERGIDNTKGRHYLFVD